jgi:hypothetical protein
MPIEAAMVAVLQLVLAVVLVLVEVEQYLLEEQEQTDRQ